MGRTGDSWLHPCEYVPVLNAAQNLVKYLVLGPNSHLSHKQGKCLSFKTGPTVSEKGTLPYTSLWSREKLTCFRNVKTKVIISVF